jgi:hypothetical protein
MTKPDPELLPERPRCPECESRMALALIEPVSSDIDLRTFECAKCGEILKIIVDSPLKADRTTGSQNSELKSPT